MNSGGGSHATSQASLLQDTKAQFVTTIQMANGTRSRVKGTGKADLLVDGGETLELEDVRLVEDLQVNIISFGLLVWQGFTFKQVKEGGKHSIL